MFIGHNFIQVSILASSMMIAGFAASADEIAQPVGDVLLTISGNIENTNREGVAIFDIDMLKELPRTEFATTTIWTQGNKEFAGVALQDLLEFVGGEGSSLRAIAVNDYAVEIPIDSLGAVAPIVAYELNGSAMSLRNNGPLWIVYPYDTDDTYRTEVIYSRSIWQLVTLEVLE